MEGNEMGFTKLDEGILQSSIMGESPETFKVWIALLASCKQDGISRVSSVFLSSVCHLSLDEIDQAIEILEKPDKRSRSMSEEGRRIKRVDGGYLIVNYQKYREFTYSDNPESVRKREYRSKEKVGHNGTCPEDVPESRDIMGHGGTSAGHSASVYKPIHSLLTSKIKSKTTTINYNTSNLIWDGIDGSDMEGWAKAYPACDINAELAKMSEWIKANPNKGVKSNYRRFIVNWLSRAQDSGGSKNVPESPRVGESKRQSSQKEKDSYAKAAELRVKFREEGYSEEQVQDMVAAEINKGLNLDDE
jgi:hypothetical protein